MAKNYNPFKMWGSWVGAVVYFLLVFLSSSFKLPGFLREILITPLFSRFDASIVEGMISGSFNISIFLMLVLPIILGFLLGWTIHSLIRRFKN